MNAIAIIQSVFDHGGDLKVAGNDILLSAPQPLPTTLVAQVREHKSEIIDVLAVNSLTSRFLAEGRIRIDSDWAGTVWLVASVDDVRGDEDGSVYFPNEIPFIVNLSAKERRLVNGFKRCFGGTIDIHPLKGDQ